MNRRDFLSCLTATCAVATDLSISSTKATPEERTAVSQVLDLKGKRLAVTEQREIFPLDTIQLLDGPLAQQQEENRQYLLKLEPDRLLSCFRQAAGLQPKAPPYRGWESDRAKPLWGHILGFYLSGTGMMVQATRDLLLRQRLNYITDELAEVQAANGSGYFIAVPEGKELFSDVAAGRFEITNADAKYGYEINNVFEPTYTWNKLTLGLFEAYKATGNSKTRDVLIHAADWLGHDVLDKLSDEQVQRLLFCEHGSIHESMVDVFVLTGDPKYLRWARRLCFERMLEPLAKGDGTFLDGYHANCSIPIYTGFERVYQHTGEMQLHTAAVNFLNEVIDHRSWVIGGNSAHEHFFPVDQFEKALHAVSGPESCNSVNMLRLAEAVYTTAPTSRILDQYERILWNHILAAHEPGRSMVSYYTPMQPGMYRVYSDEFDSMWCCVGTGLEVPGKYGQMIYSHDAGLDSLDVNLFVASRLTWKEANFALEQRTKFPDTPETTITVLSHTAEPFSLRIRHPWWIYKGEMQLRLNGKAVSSDSAPGGFGVIRRRWNKGDVVEVSLPMHLSVELLPHSQNYLAILYGPIVLAGSLGTEGLTKRDFWQIDKTVPTKIISEDSFPMLTAGPDELLRSIQPVAGRPLTFAINEHAANPAPAILIPFFRNHYERYAIYWRYTGS